MRDVRQDSSDYVRRWFFDDYFDLIAWYKLDGILYGFQLCYDKADHERALTWKSDAGITHSKVDSGDQNPWFNRSPILVTADGRQSMAWLLTRFQRADKNLPEDLRKIVKHKIREYGKLGPPPISLHNGKK